MGAPPKESRFGEIDVQDGAAACGTMDVGGA